MSDPSSPVDPLAEGVDLPEKDVGTKKDGSWVSGNNKGEDTSKVSPTWKEASSASSSSASASATNEEDSPKPPPRTEFIRPFVLSNYLVRLEGKTAPAGSSASDAAYENWLSWKTRLNTNLHEEKLGFDFSSCSSTQNTWYGKRLDTKGYCEMGVSIYQDIPPSNGVIIELYYIMGEHEQFLEFFKRVKSWFEKEDFEEEPQKPHGVTELPEAVMTDDAVLANTQQLLDNIEQSTSIELKIIWLRRLILVRKTFDSILKANNVSANIVDVLEKTLQAAPLDSLWFEFTVSTIISFVADIKYAEMFSKETATVHKLVAFLLQTSHKDPHYYKVISTVRSCLGILCSFSMVDNSSLEELKTESMVKDKSVRIFTQIKDRHDHGDKDVKSRLQRLSSLGR